MLPRGHSTRGPAEPGVALRRRCVPTRVVGNELILARPRDGAPLLMAPVAAVVWRLFGAGTTRDHVCRGLAEAFPDVAEEERVAAVTEVLRLLRDDDLIERG